MGTAEEGGIPYNEYPFTDFKRFSFDACNRIAWLTFCFVIVAIHEFIRKQDAHYYLYRQCH